LAILLGAAFGLYRLWHQGVWVLPRFLDQKLAKPPVPATSPQSSTASPLFAVKNPAAKPDSKGTAA
jgi:type III secretion protein J